jgi:Lrp/AsnC family transcriptional regulator for asnA, asnC and gidA
MKNNFMENKDIDKIDIKIISVLLKNAKMTYNEIAEKLNISASTVHIRIKKLETLNIIRGFSLKVDFAKLGMKLTAYIGFIINPNLHKKITSELLKIEEIIDLHHTTGKYHLFAKVICRDTDQLRELLQDKLNTIEGIEKTETMISLGEIAPHY